MAKNARINSILLLVAAAISIAAEFSERPRSCDDIRRNAKDTILNNGVYKIFPKTAKHGIQADCDFSEEGGAWTVIQRRHEPTSYDCTVDFYRGWDDYENGFGVQGENGSYWLGLKNIHDLTKCEDAELRVNIMDWYGNEAQANYSLFRVGSALYSYELTIGGFSGNITDSLVYHNGMKFTTFDRDNDAHATANRGVDHHGGWWYKTTAYANLNGRYIYGGNTTTGIVGITWYNWRGDYYSLKRVEMKVRPLAVLDDEEFGDSD